MPRLNAYRIMWLVVLFDLPTVTKVEKAEYRKFKKHLEEDGFSMFQYSVYMRHCDSRERLDTMKRRVTARLPPAGRVSMMMFTDKQFGMTETWYGVSQVANPEGQPQLMLF